MNKVIGTGLALLASVLLLPPAPARAGSCGPGCNTVCPSGCDFPSPAACAIGDADGDGVGDGGLIADGDICQVLGGTYHETIATQITPTPIQRTGLLIGCFDPLNDPCVIDGDSERAHGVAGYTGWMIDGLTVRNTTSHAITSDPASPMQAVQNCRIEAVGGRGIDWGGAGGLIQGNRIAGAWGDGIACAGPGVTVKNNLVVDAALGGGAGITCLGAGSVIRHNTVDLGAVTAPLLALASFGIQGDQASFNLVIGGSTSLFSESSSMENLAWAWGSQAWAASAPGAGDLTADPGLCAPGDHHLCAGSPAIDGAPSSIEAIDFEGQARDGTPDMGADEFDPAHQIGAAWPFDELVTGPLEGASPAMVVAPGLGPRVFFFDATSAALVMSERLVDGSQRRVTIQDNAPIQSDGALETSLRSLAAATDLQGGLAVVWVQDEGGQATLRSARYDPSGCGTGCASPFFSGCDAPAIFTTSGHLTIDAAFHPYTGQLGVALVHELPGGCGADPSTVVSFWEETDNGWQRTDLEDGQCASVLGRGVALVQNPMYGSTGVLYSRTPAGSDDGELVYAERWMADFTLETVPLGPGVFVYPGRENLIRAAYNESGDYLGVAFSRHGAGTEELGFIERLAGMWAQQSELVDALGPANSGPLSGLDVSYDANATPRVASARAGVLRVASRPMMDWEVGFADCRRDTGGWVTADQTDQGGLVLAHQGRGPDKAIHLMASGEPGGAPLTQVGLCEDGDACTLDECDGAGGCNHSPITCDDGLVCTGDDCDPDLGCQHPPLAAGTDCGDGERCNGDEVCDGAGACAAGTPPPVCAPGSYGDCEPCTPCPVDTYQDQAGQPGCIPCPAGTSAPQGASALDQCVPDATAPSAPTNGRVLLATCAALELAVDPPVDDGGAAIASYTWIIDAGGTPQVHASATPGLTLDGLLPETSHAVAVTATNEAGLEGPALAFDAATLACGPAISTYAASDPDAGDSVWSAGDVLTLRFDQATNQPGGGGTLDRATVEALFSFSRAPGADYTGAWVDPATFEITLVATGDPASAPVIGLDTAQVRPEADLRDEAGASAAATPTSPPLSGDWGTGGAIGPPSAPRDGLVAAASCSTLTLGVSPPLDDGGAAIVRYTWVLDDGASTETLFGPGTSVTFDGLAEESTFSVHVTATNAAGHVSPALAFDAATPPCPPAIVAFEAVDHDNRDTVYSRYDALIIHFDRDTNRPGVTDVLDMDGIDALFQFSHPPAELYSGGWLDPRTFGVSIDGIDEDAPAPIIGVYTVRVLPEADLRTADGASAPSTSVSPALSGNWGDGSGEEDPRSGGKGGCATTGGTATGSLIWLIALALWMARRTGRA